MAPPRRASARRRIGSTLLAAALLVGAGAVAAYALGRAELTPLFGGRIPLVAYEAYQSASDAAPTITDSCRVDWSVLAGIAQVESRHGQIDADHQLSADGDVEPPIRGPALDGRRGTQTIADTDAGELDGDATWDRAMGPLQFIPTTWRELGRDGNDDGTADPDNLFDASLTAAAHLCLREPGDYADRGELRRALIAYNASGRYADDVLRWIDRYQSGPLDEILEQPENA
ncbi:MAG TPA: lytic transglycosylase domain-containing protein [Candidatus Limnocylindrales bacterium]|nr:lytic transglycosylase domain-containing protein [Candidatus Limnocylindrales bacterium]